MVNSVRCSSLIIGLIFIFIFSSCATNDHRGKTFGTIAGAAVGAGISAALGGNPLHGALIGAGAGLFAGFAYDYNVKRTKDAVEVENDFKKNRGEQLPTETIISKYLVRTDPPNLVRRGDEVNFFSEIEIIKGTKSYTQEEKIEEELTIYNNSPDFAPKKLVKEINKDVHSGAYETNLVFKFRASESLEQGLYDYKKTLYLNGKSVKESEGRFQVVIANQQMKIAFLDDCCE